MSHHRLTSFSSTETICEAPNPSKLISSETALKSLKKTTVTLSNSSITNSIEPSSPTIKSKVIHSSKETLKDRLKKLASLGIQ
jgi:hypothetical protein